jgi:L,D-transpeptidase catalytic domain
MMLVRTGLATVAALALLACAPLAMASPSVDADRLPKTERLGDERARTVWAHPVKRGPVLSRPRPGARRTSRLRLRTEDGFREVYVVLRRHVDARGRRWFQLRLPARPNGQRGWVSGRALGRLQEANTRLVIGRRALRAVFYRRGRRVWSARIGIGAPGTPTPAGPYWVREVFSVRGDTIYGPFAIGTSAYSVLSDWPGGGVVGIHGTNQPGLIPGRPSHGCIRMRNRDITWLARNIQLGTPVRIR